MRRRRPPHFGSFVRCRHEHLTRSQLPSSRKPATPRSQLIRGQPPSISEPIGVIRASGRRPRVGNATIDNVGAPGSEYLRGFVLAASSFAVDFTGFAAAV